MGTWTGMETYASMSLFAFIETVKAYVEIRKEEVALRHHG